MTALAELHALESALNSQPEGLGLLALSEALSPQAPDLPRRTLQPRLATLGQSGRVYREGGGPSTVYRSALIPAAPAAFEAVGALSGLRTVLSTAPRTPAFGYATAPAPQAALLVAEPVEAYVPLSSRGLEIKRLVRRPLRERRAVGYDRNFLERYRPNQDFYLLPEQRERLHEIGCTPGEERPAGTYARAILGRLLIDLSWASSRLEGNTYTLLETQRLVVEGVAADGKPPHEALMILNHKAAIEMIVDGVDMVSFDRYTVMNLHAALSENLMEDPNASGRLRGRPVSIGGSAFAPLSVPQQLEECFDLVLERARQIEDPFEQAFFGMVHLPYLQPFEDVNKRVSRLMANVPLVRANLCPLSFIDVAERAYIDGTLGVYELQRVELLRDVFVRAYERSCQDYLNVRQEIGEPDAFRFQYYVLLREIVREVILGEIRGTRAEIERLTRGAVPAHDLSAFIDVVQTDLNYLYEGNVARFRVSRADFENWPFKRAMPVEV